MVKRPNLRVLATGGVDHGAQVELRSIDGGMLVQEVDHVTEDPATFTFPTDRKPTDAEMAELEFAWKVCKGVSPTPSWSPRARPALAWAWSAQPR